jgi:hypothetical protein
MQYRLRKEGIVPRIESVVELGIEEVELGICTFLSAR